MRALLGILVGILVAGLAAIACSRDTALPGSGDAGDARDAAGAADLAPRDQSPAPDLTPPVDLAGSRCNTDGCPAGSVCVFLDRGDCAQYLCAAVPSACVGKADCSCLGDGFCQGFAMWTGEMLTCEPTPSFLPPDVVACRSTILCV